MNYCVHDVLAVFLFTPEKEMSNNYAPCFNIANYVISSYSERSWDE